MTGRLLDKVSKQAARPLLLLMLSQLLLIIGRDGGLSAGTASVHIRAPRFS